MIDAHEQDEPVIPEGFYEYESLADAIKQAEDNYDRTGITDLYSTGFSLLDEYLGGGYGQRNGYEIMMIHSGSKMMKSTIATYLMVESLKKGVKEGWIILEGTFAEAIERARRTQVDVKHFDSFIHKMAETDKSPDQQLYYMSSKMTDSDYTLANLIDWMKHVHSLGVDLFFIDPLGYAFDFSVRDKSESDQWSRQAKFMQRLSKFCSQEHVTVVVLQHNTKDNSEKNNVFRQAAIGGSQALTKAATKVIEIRREAKKDRVWNGRLNGTGEGSAYPNGTEIEHLSLEMYFSRHTKSRYGQPFLLDVYDFPDEFGVRLIPKTIHGQNGVSAQEIAKTLLAKKAGDIDRDVWHGLITE